MQRKLTTEQIGKLKQARNGICSVRSIWEDTDEGRRDWQTVVDLIDAKIHNGTSDGRPWKELGTPIPDGWRKADHPDDYKRDDAQFLSKKHHEWRDRSKCSQGLRFFSGYTYIVPIEPELTDKDACGSPRLLVMVRDEGTDPWQGPKKLIEVFEFGSHRYQTRTLDGRTGSWEQARRATPAEIEAAGLDQSTKVEPCRGHDLQGPQ